VTVRALRVGVPDLPPGRDTAEHAAAAASARRLPVAIVLVIGAAMLIQGLTGADPALAAVLIGVGGLMTVAAFTRLTPPGTLVVRRGLPAAVILRGVLTFAFFAADVYVALALVDVRGLRPAEAGLALTAATLSWTAGSWIQARNARRFSARTFVASGFAIVTTGIAGFALVLLPEAPVILGVVIWAFVGLGMGLSYSPLALVVLRDAAPAQQGASTSALQLSDVLGTALGAGVGGALVAAGERAGDLAIGLAAAFGVAALAAAAGLLGSPRLGGEGVSRPMVAPEVEVPT
jgi:predicted MFS family arabinose efflux permease